MIAFLFWLFTGSILYTYVGYPGILSALARLRRRPHYHLEELPSVTMVIAAFNEADVIAKKIENSLSLDYPKDRFQILVANDGSTDGTTEIVQSFAKQDVEQAVAPERRGKMGNINHAVRFARGEIVVFSDATNMYAPDALQELVKPFADPSVGIVGGAHHIVKGDGALGESEGLYWRYEAFILTQEAHLNSCTAMPGDMLAIRRALYQPAPETVINDDFYMTMKMIRSGRRVVFTPRARCYERISPTAQDEIARRSRMIAGRYQAIAMSPKTLPWNNPLAVWQVVSHKFMRPLVPFAMIGALLANLLALIWPRRMKQRECGMLARLLHLTPPFNCILMALQLTFYALAFLGGSQENKRGGRLGTLLYLPAFLVNSNLAALQGLARFLRGKQSTRWQRVARREITQQ